MKASSKTSVYIGTLSTLSGFSCSQCFTLWVGVRRSEISWYCLWKFIAASYPHGNFESMASGSMEFFFQPCHCDGQGRADLILLYEIARKLGKPPPGRIFRHPLDAFSFWHDGRGLFHSGGSRSFRKIISTYLSTVFT